MRKPLHLAIVTPFPPRLSGIGQYGYHVSRALVRTGVFERVSVLTETAPDTPPVERCHRLRIERLWRCNGLDAGWRIAVRLQQLKPDLVWYNLGASSFGRSPAVNVCGLLSPALGRLAGLPAVVTLHETVEQSDLGTLGAPGGRLASWGARLVRLLTTQADVVCVTLRRQADWLAARDPSVCLVHIPHGVFDAPQLLEKSGELALLFFGSLAPFKGLDLLLDAFRRLQRHYPSLRLVVAGSEHPRYPGYLSRAWQAFKQDPAVDWLGCVPEVKLREVFARATLVVLPYLATTGSSSVLYRAAGWGRPIVASDLPELRSLVEEERLRVEFFPKGDRACLAATLERLLADPELGAAQARHNYLTVASRLTLADTCQAYLRAFDLALAARHRAAPVHLPVQPPPEIR